MGNGFCAALRGHVFKFVIARRRQLVGRLCLEQPSLCVSSSQTAPQLPTARNKQQPQLCCLSENKRHDKSCLRDRKHGKCLYPGRYPTPGVCLLRPHPGPALHFTALHCTPVASIKPPPPPSPAPPLHLSSPLLAAAMPPFFSARCPASRAAPPRRPPSSSKLVKHASPVAPAPVPASGRIACLSPRVHQIHI